MPTQNDRGDPSSPLIKEYEAVGPHGLLGPYIGRSYCGRTFETSHAPFSIVITTISDLYNYPK